MGWIIAFCSQTCGRALPACSWHHGMALPACSSPYPSAANKSCCRHRPVHATPPKTLSPCASNALSELMLPQSQPSIILSTPTWLLGGFAAFCGAAALCGCVQELRTPWHACSWFISIFNVPMPHVSSTKPQQFSS